MDVVAGTGTPAPSSLYVIDPAEARVAFDRWILEGAALEHLRELNRRGRAMPTRLAVGGDRLTSRPVRATLTWGSVGAVLCWFVAAVYALLALRRSAALPGWPQVPLSCAAIGLAAATLVWTTQRRANRMSFAPPLAQVSALLTELDRRRIAQPDDSAVELASGTRRAWNALRASEHWDSCTEAERDAWRQRVDLALWGIARTQVITDRSTRARLLTGAREDCEALIGELEAPAQASGPPAETGGLAPSERSDE